MDWLEVNRNKQKILLLQQQRENLVREAISGRRSREDCRMEIHVINRDIERLYYEGAKLEYVQ